MTLLATVNGRGTLAARPAAQASNEGYIYSASDASLYRSNGSSWDTIASTGLADQGTFTFLDGTVAAAPATPAAGKLRMYAKTGKVLAVKDDAGVETVLGAGGGGSDLVQVASGAGSVRVPGIALPDRVPAAPHASDDEFDAASTFATVLGTLDTNAVSGSHLRLVKNATGAFQIHGVYKAIPAMPFTVTAKISDMSFDANYQRIGLMLVEAGPGKILETGVIFHSTTGGANLGYGIWASRTSRTSFVDIGADSAWGLGPHYVRMVVASATSVSTYVSKGGLVWRLVGNAVNPGFTPAFVGIHLTGQDFSVTVDGYVDWVRFS